MSLAPVYLSMDALYCCNVVSYGKSQVPMFPKVAGFPINDDTGCSQCLSSERHKPAVACIDVRRQL